MDGGSPSEAVPGGDDGNVTHLILFAHGLTSACCKANLCHGLAVLHAFQAEQQTRGAVAGAALVLSVANAGETGRQTMALTLEGVEAGGARLAAEAVGLVRRFPRCDRLSLVGCSMGGLFARHAARLLFGGDCGAGGGVFGSRAIRPHALITLATPHLGVYGTAGLQVLHEGDR
jgi:hypothetical protein